MRIQINGQDIHLPESTADVTLGQAISYQQQYGKELTARYREIVAMEDEQEQEIALAEWNLEKMYCMFAFYSGCSVEAVKASPFLDKIENLYTVLLKPLQDLTMSSSYERTYEFNGATWHLMGHELVHGHDMTFGELIDSKQLVKDAMDQKQDLVEFLPKICAIFLRKPGEEYQESFLYPGSERLKLMEQLPLSIAMDVAFFFIRSMITWQRASRYSFPRGSRVAAKRNESTCSAGAGSTSSRVLHPPKSLTWQAAIASTVYVPVGHLTSLSMHPRRRN